LCWHVTVSCPLADSYLQTVSGSAGIVAELTATAYMQSLEVQQAGPHSGLNHGDDKDFFLVSTHFCSFLFINLVLLHNSFVSEDCLEVFLC